MIHQPLDCIPSLPRDGARVPVVVRGEGLVSFSVASKPIDSVYAYIWVWESLA